MVWFVIALGLFCRDSYRQVFKGLQAFRRKGTPGRSTFCEARQRLGPAPLRRLAEQVIELQATPETPGAFYRGLRLMALDGFVVDVADSPDNARIFGRPGSGRSPAAFPQARVLALCEVGTHVLWRTLTKPCRRGEVPMARRLAGFLQEDMLLLWDRGFLSYDLVRRVRRRRAQLLARIKNNLVFRPPRRLRDGSYLAKLYPSPRHCERDEGGVVVRIIEYTWNDPGRSGSGRKHRLLTTSLDAGRHPARRLIVLYHERWEEEIDHRRVEDASAGASRAAERDAGRRGSGDRGSAARPLRGAGADERRGAAERPAAASVVVYGGIEGAALPPAGAPRSRAGLRRWYEDLLAEIAEEVLPARRNRINPRVIKRKMSNGRKKRPEHRRCPQPTKEFRQSVAVLY